MPKFMIFPWHSPADLLELRARFYWKPNSNRPDERSDAVAEAFALKSRGGTLPLVIESTALLVDAQVQHDRGQMSIPSIRGVHASAVSRFVTGFCDSQQAFYVKQTMFDMATIIGLDKSLVQLRHELTHGALPSIRRLEESNRLALEWLWDKHWSRLDQAMTASRGLLTSENLLSFAIREQLIEVLRTFKQARTVEIKKKIKLPDTPSPAAAKACPEIVDLCKDNKQNISTLVELLVASGMIVPSDKTHVADIPRRSFSNHSQQARFTNHSMLDVKLDPFREAMHAWLVHILVEDPWKEVRKRSVSTLYEGVMSICCLYPVFWGMQLGSILLLKGNRLFKKGWVKPYSACWPEVDMTLLSMERKGSTGSTLTITESSRPGSGGSTPESRGIAVEDHHPTENKEAPTAAPSAGLAESNGNQMTTETRPPAENKETMPPVQSSHPTVDEDMEIGSESSSAGAANGAQMVFWEGYKGFERRPGMWRKTPIGYRK
ncbi:Las1-domain-containing protein [Patellaria atrata CBS 101060]|uniref:Las1-domain-containing protein n=1 Tax=Patellaria atrata CBS 101060 TaxID=1346257 RepID=A0A9P4S4H5_9PEZI|nr:Las1-domain-containing protein [Patellaria atrata CBS 101060]